MQPYIITPPDPELLTVSLEQAKAQCRMDIDLEDDLFLRLIRSASSYAANYQQRTYFPTEYGMKLNEFPCRHGSTSTRYSPTIPFPLPPFRSLVSIIYTAPSGDPVTMDGAMYEFDATATPAVAYPAYGHFWPVTRCHRNSVTVRWWAGYDEGAIPSETQSAILLIVAHLFEHREAISETTFNEVPMAAKDLLDIHRWGNYTDHTPRSQSFGSS